MGNRIVNLDTFAGGTLAVKLNEELQNIIDNIADPNTDATKVRKLTLTIAIKPTAKRSTAQVQIQAKSALSPVIPSETTIVIDKDIKTGKIIAAEIGGQVQGQMEMELDIDVEEKQEPGATVIDLRKAKNE